MPGSFSGGAPQRGEAGGAGGPAVEAAPRIGRIQPERACSSDREEDGGAPNAASRRGAGLIVSRPGRREGVCRRALSEAEPHLGHRGEVWSRGGPERRGACHLLLQPRRSQEDRRKGAVVRRGATIASLGRSPKGREGEERANSRKSERRERLRRPEPRSERDGPAPCPRLRRRVAIGTAAGRGESLGGVRPLGGSARPTSRRGAGSGANREAGPLLSVH